MNLRIDYSMKIKNKHTILINTKNKILSIYNHLIIYLYNFKSLTILKKIRYLTFISIRFYRQSKKLYFNREYFI